MARVGPQRHQKRKILPSGSNNPTLRPRMPVDIRNNAASLDIDKKITPEYNTKEIRRKVHNNEPHKLYTLPKTGDGKEVHEMDGARNTRDDKRAQNFGRSNPRRAGTNSYAWMRELY